MLITQTHVEIIMTLRGGRDFQNITLLEIQRTNMLFMTVVYFLGEWAILDSKLGSFACFFESTLAM